MVVHACNPATQEAEAGELPEARRQRLWWAEIAPLHSSLGYKSETPSQKKIKKAVNLIIRFTKLKKGKKLQIINIVSLHTPQVLKR